MADLPQWQLDRADELLRGVGEALLEVAPEGWRRLDLVCRSCATVQDMALTAVAEDGETWPLHPPDALFDAMAEVRRLTYRPGKGAWFSARFSMEPPARCSLVYNYEHDPRWDPPLPSAALERDLTEYPRVNERVPEWLIAAIEEVAGEPPPPRAPGSVGPRERDDLLRSIAVLLVMAAPAEWQELRLECRAVGRYLELPVELVTVDGATRWWTPPPEARRLFVDLRSGMYRRDAGTWTTASLTVRHPARYAAEFDTDREPNWSSPPPARAYADELRMFPRAPEQTPEWLLRRTGRPVPDRAPREGPPAAPPVLPPVRPVRVFDGVDASGRPFVRRPPVPPEEVGPLLEYLELAPVVLTAPGFAQDALSPVGVADVPRAFHTDGAWVWPAAVPHHLRRHGLPPQTELVEHARARGFRLPAVSTAARDAAVFAMTGRPPAADGCAEPERRVLTLLRRRLDELGVLPDEYGIGRPTGPDQEVLERRPDGRGWQVTRYLIDASPAQRPVAFDDVRGAATYLLGTLLIDTERAAERAARRARLAGFTEPGGRFAAAGRWPFQPLPGEPPLSLFRDRRVVELPAGTEVDRFGEPEGNLTYAAGTEWSARSLPAEWRRRPYHVYRLTRPLPAITGRAVPWFGQPGGGIGYLLPRSVAELLAEGSLSEPDEPYSVSAYGQVRTGQ
ncbi:TNT domain-containing protein [Gandjariella thermophila]|uniref:TNT domain-containing protein n=1 Tax=Gandjariella thermophila TaxID=1931992 RepID=A0A4D4IYC6_9PSEU|nr:TNT domain-containing protein [Gandjariella thermophila]GDY29241.1 hypothetical protein GTS_08740 [Gandjariella thermophila]